MTKLDNPIAREFHAAWGHGWLTRLAALLGVSPRTIRGWLRGEYPAPKYLDLARAVARRDREEQERACAKE